jgi:hypothetical protein
VPTYLRNVGIKLGAYSVRVGSKLGKDLNSAAGILLCRVFDYAQQRPAEYGCSHVASWGA